MHGAPRFIKYVLAVGALLPGAAAAAQLRAAAEHLRSGDAHVEGVTLQLDWPDGAAHGELRVEAKLVSVASLGLTFAKLRIVCSLSRAGGEWRCPGHVDASNLARGNLQLTLGADALGAQLSQGPASLRLDAARSGAAEPSITASQVPLDWLQPLLHAAWPEAGFTTGTLDATLAIHADPPGLSGPLTLTSLGLDTDDGSVAAAELSAAGSVTARFAPATEVSLDLTLRGAELLAGAVYIALPETPIRFELQMTAGDASDWRIDGLRWRDADVLEIDASGVLVPAESGWRPSGQLNVRSGRLVDFVERYARAWLAGVGLPAFTASGQMALEIAAAGDQLTAASLRLTQVQLASGDGRVGLDGLDGDARWTRGATEQPTRLDWQAAQVYGIPLGPARIEASSRSGDLRLAAPLQVALLDGTVELQQFRWSPQTLPAESPGGLQLALQLERIDMARLSEQLGWPRFEGRLGGRLPQARYVRGTLSLDGGLAIDLFDGKVMVDALQLERPFGVAPTLSANVTLRELDLQPLTAAFGFGEISGRLDGDIRALRLIDWQPVAFDAHFATVKRSGVPRRISQRAVNDLSRVGGGLAGGLQGTAMRLFDTFGYSRIELGCRLANTVCTMSGIRGGAEPTEPGSSAAGYTVVEGSGLPRITVNGFQRQVDWPVLVARLKAVTEGQALRVE